MKILFENSYWSRDFSNRVLIGGVYTFKNFQKDFGIYLTSKSSSRNRRGLYALGFREIK